jgi:hypothetical protein
VKRVGLGLAAAGAFARLYLLRPKPNAMPENVRLVPAW